LDNINNGRIKQIPKDNFWVELSFKSPNKYYLAFWKEVGILVMIVRLKGLLASFDFPLFSLMTHFTLPVL
jgi:hypothetical protein